MDNENFKIRAYGLQELGIQYFPNSAPASASIQLKRWINLNKALLFMRLPKPGIIPGNAYSRHGKYKS